MTRSGNTIESNRKCIKKQAIKKQKERMTSKVLERFCFFISVTKIADVNVDDDDENEDNENDCIDVLEMKQKRQK